ncbi:MAG: LysM peptidoglycan-binding domain-containing protein, partial [Syntrophales bacterium LBB04]|nr:LysM peptidoglycan-binding domain-containing protein [Syntrophales bacterium LBB04]
MADLFRFVKLIVTLIVILLIACAGPYRSAKSDSGVYHRIRNGETIDMIAKMYKVSPERIAEANNIGNTEKIGADRVIFIPNAKDIDPALSPASKAQIAAAPNKNISGNKKIIAAEEKTAGIIKKGDIVGNIPGGTVGNASGEDPSRT